MEPPPNSPASNEQSDPQATDPLPPTRRWLFLLGIAAFLVLGFAALWDWVIPRPLPPVGGLYFPVQQVLEVPLHRQNDVAWGDDLLGPTQATLAEEGCAIAAASMALAYHGYEVDPGRLNAFVRDLPEGFTPQGWLYWEAAADFPPATFEKAYEDRPSYALLDRNLLMGRPSIIRIRLSSGWTHFVVVAGKKGREYLIHDPLADENSPLTPLSAYNRPIEALRFYQPR